VSPILVRPVREQLEHDRVIRALQQRFRRRFEVALNIGAELTAPIKVGLVTVFPDLVLTTTGRTAKLGGVVEVETSESVNNLEAMAQWAHLGRTKVPFSLYVPAGSVEMARRLCADHQVTVDEIWSYYATGPTQIRFAMVHRASAAKPAAAARRGARTRSASASRPKRARTRTGRASGGSAKRPAAKRKSAPAGRKSPARARSQKRK